MTWNTAYPNAKKIRSLSLARNAKLNLRNRDRRSVTSEDVAQGRAPEIEDEEAALDHVIVVAGDEEAAREADPGTVIRDVIEAAREIDEIEVARGIDEIDVDQGQALETAPTVDSFRQHILTTSAHPVSITADSIL